MNARNPISLVSAGSKLEAFDLMVRIADKTLLQASALQFAAGEVTAILGPNGAGKSTLMSVLTAQRALANGRVQMNGTDLHDWPSAELARILACMAQETQVAFNFTAREVVELGRYPHRKHFSKNEGEIVQHAMAATATGHLQYRTFDTLSGGEKARIHFARALAQVWEPVALMSGSLPARWLLLDEPTSALDLRFQHRMLGLARNRACAQGLGVVAVLHDLNLALRYADRCVVLRDGQVFAAGNTADVLTHDCIEEVWGVQARSASTCNFRQTVKQYFFELPDKDVRSLNDDAVNARPRYTQDKKQL